MIFKNLSTSKRFIAFTLAEVLITLGIIGLVAEMTIPTLMQNMEKSQYESRLKKFYSTFIQGTQMYMQEEGCSDLICTNIFNGSTYYGNSWVNPVKSALDKMFKGVVYCGAYDCQEDAKYLSNVPWGTMFTTDIDWQSFRLSDGTVIGFEDTDDWNCFPVSSTNRIKALCSNLYVDLNGNKLPNKYGRDIHIFALAQDGALYPWYGTEHSKSWGPLWSTNPLYCGTAGVKSLPANVIGNGCTARIMETGWKMDY